MSIIDTIFQASQKSILDILSKQACSLYVRGDAKQAVYALAKKGKVEYHAFADTDIKTNRSFECLQVWLKQ